MTTITQVFWTIAIFAGGIVCGTIVSDELSLPNNTSLDYSEYKSHENENSTNLSGNDSTLKAKDSEGEIAIPQNSKENTSLYFEDISTQKMERVYKLLENNFVSPEKITEEKIEEWMIRGILYSVEDDYTDYFNEEQSEEFKDEMKGDFEGIGAVLEKRKKRLYITEVLKNLPAAKSGLLPGDIIISVDEKEISDETIWETVLRIRGEKGSDVKIEVIRKGEKKTFTVTRENIHVDNATLAWKGANKDIALIEVNQFGDDLEKEFAKAFSDMKNKGYKGIIVDLRYNGGGYMQGAVNLASYFLDTGKTVLMVETKNGIEETLLAEDIPLKDTETPVIILINQGTASSSEIFTAALTEHERAMTVGEKTFGKGVVQQLFPLNNTTGEFVKITIAKWLTPNKNNVTTEDPLIPEIEIEWDRSEMTDEQFNTSYDPQLEKAIEILSK